MSKKFCDIIIDLKEVKDIPSRFILAHLVEFQGVDIEQVKKLNKMYSFANDKTVTEMNQVANRE